MSRIFIKKYFVIVMVLLLFTVVSGCSSLENNDEKTTKEYTITLEILNEDNNVISNVEVSIEKSDYLAKEIESGKYIFENIKLEKGKSYTINFYHPEYKDKNIIFTPESEEDIFLGKIELDKHINSVSKIIGEGGGEISLSDGTYLKVPEDAVTKETEITLKKETELLNNKNDIYENVIYRVNSDVKEFNKEVELIYSLPNHAPSEKDAYLVGFIDDKSGFMVQEFNEENDWQIRKNEEGELELNFNTKSFIYESEKINTDVNSGNSTYIGTPLKISYISEELPDLVDPIDIPYYNQGNTGYCWAFSYQMQTAAYMSPKNKNEVWDIIGKYGIQGGLSTEQILSDNKRNEIYANRTGWIPEVIYWNTELGFSPDKGISFIDYVKHQLHNGRPIALWSANKSHVQLLTGYDDREGEIKFFVQDPAKSPPIQEKSKDELGIGKIPLYNSVVTIVIPDKIEKERSKVTINIGDPNFTMSFVGPKENFFRKHFIWDHEKEKGYSFDGENKIYSNIEMLDLKEVALANSSQENQIIDLNLKIIPQVVEENENYSYTIENIELNNNNFQHLKDLLNNDLLEIPAEDFLIKSEKELTYELQLNIIKDGDINDHKNISFDIKPVESLPSIYAVSSNSLYKLTLGNRFSSEFIGDTQTLDGKDVELTDIALNPLDNKMYGVSFREFYKIDQETAEVTHIGSHGYSDVNSLDFNKDGELFAATASGELLQLDPSTGKADLIGEFGNGYQASGDLQFLPDGKLVATVHTGTSWLYPSPDDELAEINLETAEMTIIGEVDFDFVYGLTEVKGKLYGGTDGGDFILINEDTGKGSYIDEFGFSMMGMD